MANIYYTDTSRLPKTQYRFTVLDNLFQVLEPDPLCYGKPTVSEAADQLAKNVRLLRTVRGWSQETLAFNAGLDRTFVGAIERAERNLTLATAEKIAKAFKLTVGDLISPQTTEAIRKALSIKYDTSN